MIKNTFDINTRYLVVIASDGIWEQLKPEEVGRLVVESAESARAVTSQFAGTVTAAFTVWLSKFGCLIFAVPASSKTVLHTL